MSKIFRESIERLALQILMDLNLHSIPVNVRDVAKKSNIDIIFPELSDEVSGVLATKNGISRIFCNKKQGYYRQRFTIAHELGHYYLNHQRVGYFVDNNENQSNFLFRSSDTNAGDFEQEVEANAFAAALLMPADLLCNEVSKLREQEDDFNLSDIDEREEKMIKKLAKKFNVSKIAMTYRIGKLNLIK